MLDIIMMLILIIFIGIMFFSIAFLDKVENIIDILIERFRENPRLKRKVSELYEELEEAQEKLDFICGSHDD